jgi:hypothetical protein
MTMSDAEFTEIWGAYPNYDDIARLEYGRMMWRRPAMRARLLTHWSDPLHPYRERFIERRALVESVLDSDEEDGALHRSLLASGTSLRCVGSRSAAGVWRILAGDASMRVHGKGHLGAKPCVEVVSEILAAGQERRAQSCPR